MHPPQYVDILIPSKDRAMQLHLLLESMGRHLTGMGRIYITWQGSNEKYRDAYELLEKRVLRDLSFEGLRNKSKEIIFRSRNKLREVYDAAIDSGDSEFILPLVDEDVFFSDYDLVNDQASKVFFENRSNSFISCSIRLGDNLSDQVSISLVDGIVSENITGHATSLLSTGKPRFVYPQFGHQMFATDEDKNVNGKYLIWAWVDNLNVPHWNIPWSTTGNIYKKTEYLGYIESFGRENFLAIEGIVGQQKLREFLKLPGFLFLVLKILDKLQSKILRWSGFYEQDVFQILLSKYIYMKRYKKKRMVDLPIYMVAPKKSVVVNLDAGSSHNREFGYSVFEHFNNNYLDGFVIFFSEIPFNNVKFPTHTYKGFKLVRYAE